MEGSDKMNRKGFSLVELLAMMVVISILMVIAVPNIVGILKNSREDQGLEDVNNLINGAKAKISSKQAANPKETDACVIMTLGFIDTANNITTGQNDKDYNRKESIVIIKKKQEGSSPDIHYRYVYYFRLVESPGSECYILGWTADDGFISFDDFSKNPKSPIDHDMTAEDQVVNRHLSETEMIEALTQLNKGTELCHSVEGIYK